MKLIIMKELLWLIIITLKVLTLVWGTGSMGEGLTTSSFNNTRISRVGFPRFFGEDFEVWGLGLRNFYVVDR
jgi:hypothetical protein